MCLPMDAFFSSQDFHLEAERRRRCFGFTPTAPEWSRIVAITAIAAGSGRWGGKQLASGDVVFTHGGSLARFTSPLAHEERMITPRGEYADGIAETESGALVVSAREAAHTSYALKLWTPGSAKMGSRYGAGPARTLLIRFWLLSGIGRTDIRPRSTIGITRIFWRWMRASRAMVH